MGICARTLRVLLSPFRWTWSAKVFYSRQTWTHTPRRLNSSHPPEFACLTASKPSVVRIQVEQKTPRLFPDVGQATPTHVSPKNIQIKTNQHTYKPLRPWLSAPVIWKEKPLGLPGIAAVLMAMSTSLRTFLKVSFIMSEEVSKMGSQTPHVCL